METKCSKCNDTGKVTIANGADDFDFDFCSCPVGQAMFENEQEEEFRVDKEWGRGDSFFPPNYQDFTHA